MHFFNDDMGGKYTWTEPNLTRKEAKPVLKGLVGHSPYGGIKPVDGDVFMWYFSELERIRGKSGFPPHKTDPDYVLIATCWYIEVFWKTGDEYSEYFDEYTGSETFASLLADLSGLTVEAVSLLKKDNSLLLDMGECVILFRTRADSEISWRLIHTEGDVPSNERILAAAHSRVGYQTVGESADGCDGFFGSITEGSV